MSLISRPSLRLGFCFLLALPVLHAEIVWKAPSTLPFGELTALELRENDPQKPGIPRVAEEQLGSLPLRSVDPMPDGHGWIFKVQPLQPGAVVIPSMDLGDGRKTPELRITVLRSTPYGAPWMGVGGGREDILPAIPFPWAWASLLLLPVLALAFFFIKLWFKGSHQRTLAHARRSFTHAWPPINKDRKALDEAHQKGRDLLALHFGEEARSWGGPDFHQHRLQSWSTWIQSLDAARFARKDPPFPALPELLKNLEEVKKGEKRP